MKTVRDTLISARSYIERGWTQGSHAKDASGAIVITQSPDAVAWCALGGIIAVTGAETPMYEAARERLRGVLPRGMVSVWNDAPERTQADVLAAFDRAIAGCV